MIFPCGIPFSNELDFLARPDLGNGQRSYSLVVSDLAFKTSGPGSSRGRSTISMETFIQFEALGPVDSSSIQSVPQRTFFCGTLVRFMVGRSDVAGSIPGIVPSFFKWLSSRLC